MKEAKEQRIRALKDHLRSLSDRKPPPQAAPPSESVSAEAPTSLKASGSVVTITADGRTGKGFIVDGDGMDRNKFPSREFS